MTTRRRSVKVAACQLTPKLGDKAYNLGRAVDAIAEAAGQGADFICFPEMFYTGYDVPREQLLQLAEPADGKMYRVLGEAAEAHGIHVVMSYPETTPIREIMYISVMTIDDKGKRIGNHRKTYLWKEEKALAKPGSEYGVIDTKFGKVAALICYEMEYPELARIMALKGAKLLFFSSAYMGVHLMSRYLAAVALQNLMHVVGVNMVGHGKNGFSQIIDPLGEVIVAAPQDKEAIIYADIDLDSDVRLNFPHWHDLRLDTFEKCLHEARSLMK